VRDTGTSPTAPAGTPIEEPAEYPRQETQKLPELSTKTLLIESATEPAEKPAEESTIEASMEQDIPAESPAEKTLEDPAEPLNEPRKQLSKGAISVVVPETRAAKCQLATPASPVDMCQARRSITVPEQCPNQAQVATPTSPNEVQYDRQDSFDPSKPSTGSDSLFVSPPASSCGSTPKRPRSDTGESADRRVNAAEARPANPEDTIRVVPSRTPNNPYRQQPAPTSEPMPVRELFPNRPRQDPQQQPSMRKRSRERDDEGPPDAQPPKRPRAYEGRRHSSVFIPNNRRQRPVPGHWNSYRPSH
jgi:hypothetical protein